MMETSKYKSVWLSYDLGLKGNYGALFSFLDNHNAVECGNQLAYFEFPNTLQLNDEEIIERLVTVLKDQVQPGLEDRLYLIWKERKTGKIRSSFIHGNRRYAPWHGYKTNGKLVVIDGGGD